MLIPSAPAPVRLRLSLAARELAEGSIAAGAVRVDAAAPVALSEGTAELVRTISYQYNNAGMGGSAATSVQRSTQVVDSYALQFPPGQQSVCSAQFTLGIPATGPGSAAGRLVEVRWAVRVRVPVVGYRPAEATGELTVRSAAGGLTAAAGLPGRTVDRRFVHLELIPTSGRMLGPGATITADLSVRPLRFGVARGVRAMLLLREVVHHGPWIGQDAARNPADQGKDRDTAVAAIQLADQLVLDPAHPMTLPLALRAPDKLPAPSLSGPEWQVGWVLRAEVQRRFRTNPFAELDLHGSTLAR